MFAGFWGAAVSFLAPHPTIFSLFRPAKNMHATPQDTLPSAAQTPSWRRQGEAPPAGRKSPLIKAISKFGVRAQRTALLRIMHASPFVAANFAFMTSRKRKVLRCAVAVLSAPRECAACGQEIAAEKGDF